MISIALQGRLGNQMFQYATAYALSRRHNTYARVDCSAFHSLGQRKDFELWRFEKLKLPRVSNSQALRGTLSSRLFRRPPRFNATFTMQGLGYDEHVLGLPDGSRLIGWFQCARYFDDYAGEVRSLFDLSPFLPPRGVEEIERLRAGRSVVALHVRRGDYVGNSLFELDRETYYRAAIRYMTERVECCFVVFSDDLPWCRQQAMFRGAQFRFADELNLGTSLPLHEMALMSICTHNIISNSTFAWWAAWLGAAPGKQVVMPRQWLSKWTADECGVSNPGWAQLP